MCFYANLLLIVRFLVPLGASPHIAMSLSYYDILLCLLNTRKTDYNPPPCFLRVARKLVNPILSILCSPNFELMPTSLLFA